MTTQHLIGDIAECALCRRQWRRKRHFRTLDCSRVCKVHRPYTGVLRGISPKEVVKDSAISNAGTPSSEFRSLETQFHMSVGTCFLARKKNRDSALKEEKGRSKNAVSFSLFLAWVLHGSRVAFSFASVFAIVAHRSRYLLTPGQLLFISRIQPPFARPPCLRYRGGNKRSALPGVERQSRRHSV